MRSLNLDQLRAFLEVVECGSFSAAARRLNLSQPAVSLQIRELEQRLGVQLVERLASRRMLPPRVANSWWPPGHFTRVRYRLCGDAPF